MPECKIFTQLNEIDRTKWNSCFIGEIEDYDYLLAVEKAGIAGFDWRYLTLWGDDELIAAVPMFLTDYKLDTTLQGTGKKITEALNKTFPKLLTLKLASLGSPCTELVNIGFNSKVKNKAEILQLMLVHFEQYAAKHNYKLFGIKDITEKLAAELTPILKEKKYSALPGMPSAVIDVDFKTIDEYISLLSKKMRKDFRRKMKSFANIRIEQRKNIDDVLPEIFALYKSTKSRSEWQFEELTEDYFKNVLAMMPERSFCTLYYSGNELLAANLLVHNQYELLDKFFCMDERGREHNLYYLSWLQNIKICLERGFESYGSGQAYCALKLRLGSKLIKNTIYFKHRNALAQGILKLVAPLLSADEVTELKKEAA